MKNVREPLNDAAQLREKAEEQLKNKESRQKKHQSEVDNLKLMHELEVHQVELEMQMEELQWARNKAETANGQEIRRKRPMSDLLLFTFLHPPDILPSTRTVPSVS